MFHRTLAQYFFFSGLLLTSLLSVLPNRFSFFSQSAHAQSSRSVIEFGALVTEVSADPNWETNGSEIYVIIRAYDSVGEYIATLNTKDRATRNTNYITPPDWLLEWSQRGSFNHVTSDIEVFVYDWDSARMGGNPDDQLFRGRYRFNPSRCELSSNSGQGSIRGTLDGERCVINARATNPGYLDYIRFSVGAATQ